MDVDKWTDLMNGLRNSFMAILMAGIVGMVLLVVIVIILIIWLIKKYKQDKRQKEIELLHLLDKGRAGMDIEALGLQGNESGYVGIISAEVGSTVLFGHYKGKNGWIVLDKKDDKLLILSENGICYKKFNEEMQSVTWSTCSLRKWLNTDYLKQAFSERELEIIADTSVYTEPSSRYKIPDGENTIDKVFLLSIEEAEKYFSNNEERRTTTTEGEECYWWLRTPCGDDEAGWVNYTGEICRSGRKVNGGDISVRPAMWIDLKLVNTIRETL